MAIGLEIFVLLVEDDEVLALACCLDFHLQLVLALAEELAETDGVVGAGQNALNLHELVFIQLLLDAAKAISTCSLVQFQVCLSVLGR